MRRWEYIIGQFQWRRAYRPFLGLLGLDPSPAEIGCGFCTSICPLRCVRDDGEGIIP
jgi:hypothetical protein